MQQRPKKKIVLLLFGLLLSLSYVSAGTVLSSYKYAWSDKVGYINFENLIVSDSALSGYAWSENAGWINFSPSQGGVVNDENGNLSGSAWGEKLGWMDFDNVTINTTTGKFSGTATGLLVGTITFDCPNYCDVRTDWRPAGTPTCTSWTYSSWSTCSGGQQTRTIISSSPTSCTGGSPVVSQSCSSGGGGGGGGGGLPRVPKHINTFDTPLTILPEQSGTFTDTTDAGTVILDIPANVLQNKTTFFITPEPLITENTHLVLESTHLVNSTFYDVIAKDTNDNFVHSFSSPITITLPIPKNLQNTTGLAVYWLNETNWQWVLIPDVTFSGDTAIFQVNHLTRFVIFAPIIKPLEPPKEPEPSLPLPIKQKGVLKTPQTSTQTSGSLPRAETTVISTDEGEVSIIKKIENFVQPIMPQFLKSDNNEMTNDIIDTDKTETSTNQKSGEEIWILIILIVCLFLMFRRRKTYKSKP